MMQCGEEDLEPEDCCEGTASSMKVRVYRARGQGLWVTALASHDITGRNHTSNHYENERLLTRT